MMLVTLNAYLVYGSSSPPRFQKSIGVFSLEASLFLGTGRMIIRLVTRSSRIFLALIFLLWLARLPASAMTPEVHGSQLILNGPVVEGDWNTIFQTLESSSAVHTIILILMWFLRSPPSKCSREPTPASTITAPSFFSQ